MAERVPTRDVETSTDSFLATTEVSEPQDLLDPAHDDESGIEPLDLETPRQVVATFDVEVQTDTEQEKAGPGKANAEIQACVTTASCDVQAGVSTACREVQASVGTSDAETSVPHNFTPYEDAATQTTEGKVSRFFSSFALRVRRDSPQAFACRSSFSDPVQSGATAWI